MRRSLALAAIFALMLPALAAAEDQHAKGPPPKGHPAGPPPPRPMAPHPQFKQAVPQHGPVGNPQFKPVNPQHGPVVGGPNPQFKPVNPQHGPMGPCRASILAFVHGPHAPPPGGPQFTFHGHDFNRVHIHPFVYPNGWAYREWPVGAILPPRLISPRITTIRIGPRSGSSRRRPAHNGCATDLFIRSRSMSTPAKPATSPTACSTRTEPLQSGCVA